MMNEVQILLADLVSRYANGNPVPEKEFKLMVEGLKKNHEHNVDCDMTLTDHQKDMLKHLYVQMADSVQEYVLESLRIQNKLVE